MKTEQLLELIRDGKPMSLRQEFSLIARLALPAILAQVSTIIMFYIDAAMVGSLGAKATASIGLISSPMWLLGGMCTMFSMGFAVQVAQTIGAKDFAGARNVLRGSFIPTVGFSCVMMAVGVSIHRALPVALGGSPEVSEQASAYFLIFALTMPVAQLHFLGSAMLRCSGNIKLPSILNVIMCLLDVGFNFFLIFESGERTIMGHTFSAWGAGLGVQGAALGTGLAFAVTCCATIYFLTVKSAHLNLMQDSGSFITRRPHLRRAFGISLPMVGQHLVIAGALTVSMMIVAPLGTVAIAAHTFGIVVESISYMPGYGLSEAATTLVGQCIGAKRRKLTVIFARQCVYLGMLFMGLMGVFLFTCSPFMMDLMTPDPQVAELAVTCLRIEAFAEPLFAASMVVYGVCVGAGDTFRPSLMNFACIWGARLTSAYLLAAHLGLVGVWIAMAGELSLRGLVFLYYLHFAKWFRIEDDRDKNYEAMPA